MVVLLLLISFSQNVKLAFVPLLAVLCLFNTVNVQAQEMEHHNHHGHHQAKAQEGKGQIQVDGAYLRATIPGTEMSSAYMTIFNHSDKTKNLMAVTGDISDRIELHEHSMVDGMMRMRQVNKIVVPAQGKAVLQPSGLHLMVFNLAKPLKPQQKVKLSLHFADGSKENIIVPVEKVKPHQHKH